jgi:OmpA-OmpF porin, OOP family
MARLTLLIVTLVFCLSAAAQPPKATIPTADKKGSKDSPLLKRYEGSYIVSQEEKKFAEFELPLSKLEQVPGKKAGNNNRAYEPKNRKSLEGTYTRIVYLLPENRSPIEVLRNYQDEIKAKGGKILFECKESECGGDTRRGIQGGGGDATLGMYLYPGERLTEPRWTNGWCAVTANIHSQRYTAAEIPDAGAHVSVLTYTIDEPEKADACNAFNGRTVAVVDLVEAKAREQKMVTIQAGEMAKAIANEGRIALYGIYFDFNKSDVKSESSPTLDQMAKLLKDSPSLKLLIVGHTDNVGNFPFNMELSQRRAAAVVAALNSRGVAKERLIPVGVAFASPIATNKTDEGRAKNRRVELVEN